MLNSVYENKQVEFSTFIKMAVEFSSYFTKSWQLVETDFEYTLIKVRYILYYKLCVQLFTKQWYIFCTY